jgi:hypothetical protein
MEWYLRLSRSWQGNDLNFLKMTLTLAALSWHFLGARRQMHNLMRVAGLPHRLEIQCHSWSCQDGPVEPAMWSKTKPVFRLVVFNTF